MKATQVLMEEHRVIERVLAVLETAAQRLGRGESVPLDVFTRAAEFIKGFADGCHHMKEEGVLFPAMESAGIPAEGGPIGVMLEEHQEGRRFTGAMRAAAERLAAGDAGARDELIRSALHYVELLREHIAKEDQILFPMADETLRAQAQAEISAAFERIEQEAAGQCALRRGMDLAAAIEARIAG